MDTPTDHDPVASSPRHTARRRATDEKIITAVLEIVRRRGFAKVTIDAVAAESGVAKTTIYRRYADRADLLSAVAQRIPVRTIGEHAYTQAGLTALVHELRTSFLEQDSLVSIYKQLIGNDPLIQQWRDTSLNPHLEAVRDYFIRGCHLGIFAADVDYTMIVETIIGAMVFCAAIRGEIPEGWAERMAGMIWQLIQSNDDRVPVDLPAAAL